MGTGLFGLGEKQVKFQASVSDGLTGTQADPAATALSNGNYVVVYENPFNGGGDIDLLAHFFDANGNAINPPPTAGLTNGVFFIDRTDDVTNHPAIAPTASGFVTAYTNVTQSKRIDVRVYNSVTGDRGFPAPAVSHVSPAGLVGGATSTGEHGHQQGATHADHN